MTAREELQNYLEVHHDSISILELSGLRRLFRISSAIDGNDSVAPRHRQLENPLATESNNSVAPRNRRLVLIGQSIIGDMKVLDRSGVHLELFFNPITIGDTQILVEDTADEWVPDSLSGLVIKYDLYARVRIHHIPYLYNTQLNNQEDWVINALQQAVPVAEKYLKTLRTKQASLQSLQDSAHSSLHILRVCETLPHLRKQISELRSEISQDIQKELQSVLRQWRLHGSVGEAPHVADGKVLRMTHRLRVLRICLVWLG